MKIKFLTALGLLLLASCGIVKAQRAVYDISDLEIFPEDNSTATVRIYCDSDLKTIEKNIIAGNKKRLALGYSVQIFFGSGTDAQSKAEKVVKDFKQDFNDEDADIVYEAPYFKVHAGNCRSRLEATRLKKQVENKFPGCFIVECKINYPKL
ncbi:MAG: SPOR domain-containing protein [Bacteroidales bacterium]|nr:SPOR domain-containing protein [Bacteroidales bacterium]